MTTIADLGEFGLIARIAASLPANAGVVVGVGDDAAILDVGGPLDLVATCDAQVQGVHFEMGEATPVEIGRRALAVNLSDIAAMGAAPRFALVSLFAPPALPVAIVDGVYAGLSEEAARFDVAIVGGNVARNDRLAIDITLLGLGRRDALLRRDGARPGDALCVTGALGGAAAGLIVSQQRAIRQSLDDATAAAALADLRSPTPRVAAGQWLARHGATAAIDISDGFAADLGHLCGASRVGARVEAADLPIAPHAVTIAQKVGRDPLDLAVRGGEEYELLFTLPPADARATLDALAAATGVTGTIVGVVSATPALQLARAGRDEPLATVGWDHLRPAPHALNEDH